jgi:hypothetical protein
MDLLVHITYAILTRITVATRSIHAAASGYNIKNPWKGKTMQDKMNYIKIHHNIIPVSSKSSVLMQQKYLH